MKSADACLPTSLQQGCGWAGEPCSPTYFSEVVSWWKREQFNSPDLTACFYLCED